MAPSNKKKKKRSIVNTRPIATTSLPSKHVELPEGDAPTTALPSEPEEVKETLESPSNLSHSSLETRGLHKLSPNELEKHLQDAEIATLVEKYALNVQKESSRHTTRIQNDCRVLHGQSEILLSNRAFPQSIQSKILSLALHNIHAFSSSATQGHSKKLVGSDEIISKLWMLEKILSNLGFLQDQVVDTLKWIVQITLPLHDGSQIWGFEQSLDWLALNFEENELPKFDKISDEPQKHDENSKDGDKIQHNKTEIVNRIETNSSEEETFYVSDVGSDLEPDELINVYLSTKTKLYERCPDLEVNASKNSRKFRKGDKLEVFNRQVSPGVAKLQTKIRKLEADVLFDKTEANERWATKRHKLAQEFSEKRRLQLIEPEQNSEFTSNGDHGGEFKTEHMKQAKVDDEDQIGLGDLFGALSADDATFEHGSHLNTNDSTVIIRDFGAWKGMSPRRVLEEACRARDARIQLVYKLESAMAFSCRHSLEILWPKPQAISLPLSLPSIICRSTERFTSFLMNTIATPDMKQSEAFVSTIALFQIFAASRQEEKVYLRLPSAWRALWSELSDQWKAQIEITNQGEVRALMNLIHEPSDQAEEEGEILTESFANSPLKEDIIEKLHNSMDDQPRNENGHGAVQDRIELWNTKSTTLEYQRMLQSRKSLPIFQFREKALETIEQNQISIISGDTGCGKSTQMPAYILEHEMSRGKMCKIYCTEPRRISAITLAQRVCEEMGEKRRDLGTSRSLVGYSIRLESMISDQTRLVYATTGIVLRMLESSDGFRDVTHIIIDEVHERSIETDFLLIILRSLVSQRPELKVILMSATLDTQRFAKYFHGAPIILVPGRTFPVETKYLEDAIELTGYHIEDEGNIQNEESDTESEANVEKRGDNEGYSSLTLKTLSQIDEYRINYSLILKVIDKVAFDPSLMSYAHAILIFLPGIAEIKRLNELLFSTPILQHFVVHSLHSSISSEDQQAAFAPPPSGYRKIVIATNIAETGVTIPDVTCVIDTGKHKEMRFDEKRQISRLIESFISKANAKQRRGRAGRVQKGICFHLFSKERHDNVMAEQPTPEMLRLSLQDLVMRVKICKLGEIESTLAEALDPPSTKNVRRAIDSLIEVNALNQAEALTPLGRQLARLPLDPYLGKLVLLGAIFGCLDFSITAAAILTSKSPFSVPLGSRQQADLARLSFKKGDSDLLTDYNAYCAWRRVCISGNGEIRFCRKSFLSSQTLSNIEDLKTQLFSSVVDLGFVSVQYKPPTYSRARRFVEIPAAYNFCNDNTDLIVAVTAGAFYPKVLAREGNGWRNIGTNQTVQIHPTSVLRQVQSSAHRYLSFYSILQSGGGRSYNASSLTPVGPLPLLLLASDLSFHSIAHVVSLSGARGRYQMEGWKAFIAFKLLRKNLDEILELKWKKPAAELPIRLRKWMDIWNELAQEWNFTGATNRD